MNLSDLGQVMNVFCWCQPRFCDLPLTSLVTCTCAGLVHLTGYLIPEEPFDDEASEPSSEDEEEEESSSSEEEDDPDYGTHPSFLKWNCNGRING